MYPIPYNGESQILQTEIMSDNDSDLDKDEIALYGEEPLGTIPYRSQKLGTIYQCRGSDKYLIYQ